MTTLSLSGVSASYGATPVLRGVDLEVPGGTTTAVLGPSGCGKTTLLRVVAGFLRPDEGRVLVGGHQVAGDDVWVAPERRRLGYLSQEGNLFPHLDVAANITYGLPRRQRRARAGVEELLELVGLAPELATRRPDQLSGGQQQRVALARALARKPDVVLLDEPFSALDPELRVATRAAVAAALAHERATVVLVTHDRAEALSFADHVAVMHEGRVLQRGTPAEVYRAPVDARSAAALGEACLLPGTVDAGLVSCPLGVLLAADADGYAGPCDVLLRPEQLRLGPASTGSGRLAVVEASSYFGHEALVRLRLDAQGGGALLQARTPGDRVPAPGSVVSVEVEGPAHVLPRPAAT